MTPNKAMDDRRTLKSQIIALGVALMVCFSAAAIGGLATASGLESWFATLAKPSWNPPNWIFGPVWSTLYLMMAIAVWLVWKTSGLAKAKLAIGWFGFHLLLNILWSHLFFQFQQPGWAAVEIVFLWIAIAVCIDMFWRHSITAAALLLPYLCWVTFATFLNFTIWSLNTG